MRSPTDSLVKMVKADIHKEGLKKMGPPNGGYGWVVVLACFFCNMIADGTAWAFGVLVEPLTTEFKARYVFDFLLNSSAG